MSLYDDSLESSWAQFEALNAPALPGGMSQLDERAETRQVLNVYMDFVYAEKNSKRRELNKTRIASMKQNNKRALGLLKYKTEADKLAGKVETEKLKGMFKLTGDALKSWTGYFEDTNTSYSKVLSGFRYANTHGTPSSAWGTVAGSIQNEPMGVNLRSPRFTQTFAVMNKTAPIVEVDERGNVKYDNGKPILTALGATLPESTKKMVLGPNGWIANYDEGVSGKLVSLGQFTAVEDLLQQSRDSLTSDPKTSNERFQEALKLFKETNIGLGDKVDFDPAALAAEEAALMEEDALVKKTEAEIGRLQTKLGGEEEGWKDFVKTEQFQQWAKDRGIAVGYKTESGGYMPGPYDERAVNQWHTESLKRPGNYGLMLNQTTDEIVQITDKEGNVIGRGFRQPFHASDRPGQIRILPLSGGTQVFDKDQIGVVDVVMKLPGGRTVMGSPVRRRKMADAFKQLEATGDLTATKAAEEVAEGLYATRSLDGDEGYMSKADYDRAAAQADVEVGRFVIDKEGRQAYVRFGDAVFAFDYEAEVLTKVDDPEVIGKVMGLPAEIAQKSDGSTLLYSDVKDGAKIGALKYSQGEEEASKFLEKGRTQFLSSQGVTTTDKPRELIKGRTYTSMGITFRDSEIPERYRGGYPDPKPGQGIDTKRAPSGALPVAAVTTKEEREKTHYPGGEKRAVPKGITEAFVGDRLPDYRVQEGDAQFIREMLAQEAKDAGEPKPPAKAAKAAAAVRDRSAEPLPGEFSSEERGVHDVTTGPGGTPSYGRSAPPAKSAAAAAAVKKKSEAPSPTPENANGKTDLNTDGEVAAAEKPEKPEKPVNPDPSKKKKKKTKEATGSPEVDRSGDEERP